MLEIVGFVAVIAAVFALKAVSIVKGHDELAAKSASFSWMSMTEEDRAVAESWSVEEERVPESRVSFGTLHRVGGARA